MIYYSCSSSLSSMEIFCEGFTGFRYLIKPLGSDHFTASSRDLDMGSQEKL